MALRGYFPIEELATFDQGDSRLQGHPDMTRLPGLDASTGSLGQGLAVGVGIALGARMRGLGFQTYVMLGDGETQEGMVWESVMVAARYGLANLTAIVDCNGLQQYGWPATPGGDDRGDRRDPLAGVHLGDALSAFGWRVARGRRPRHRGDRRRLRRRPRGGPGEPADGDPGQDGQGTRRVVPRGPLRVARPSGDRRRGGRGRARARARGSGRSGRPGRPRARP